MADCFLWDSRRDDGSGEADSEHGHAADVGEKAAGGAGDRLLFEFLIPGQLFGGGLVRLLIVRRFHLFAPERRLGAARVASKYEADFTLYAVYLYNYATYEAAPQGRVLLVEKVVRMPRPGVTRLSSCSCVGRFAGMQATS